jgi:hypothetical protein
MTRGASFRTTNDWATPESFYGHCALLLIGCFQNLRRATGSAIRSVPNSSCMCACVRQYACTCTCMEEGRAAYSPPNNTVEPRRTAYRLSFLESFKDTTNSHWRFPESASPPQCLHSPNINLGKRMPPSISQVRSITEQCSQCRLLPSFITRMALSAEAIVAIVTLLVTCPATFFLAWNFWYRYRFSSSSAGKCIDRDGLTSALIASKASAQT